MMLDLNFQLKFFVQGGLSIFELCCDSITLSSDSLMMLIMNQTYHIQLKKLKVC